MTKLPPIFLSLNILLKNTIACQTPSWASFLISYLTYGFKVTFTECIFIQENSGALCTNSSGHQIAGVTPSPLILPPPWLCPSYGKGHTTYNLVVQINVKFWCEGWRSWCSSVQEAREYHTVGAGSHKFTPCGARSPAETS